MFKKSTETNTHRPTGTTRRALLVAAIAGVLSVAVAAPAGAYTVNSRSNVPVSPTIYQVQGRHYDAGSAVTGPMYQPWLYQPGPVVYRNGSSGTQYVSVTYTVQKWNGTAWNTVGTHTRSGQIASNLTSTQLPALTMTPSGFNGGYFRVLESITWTNAIGAVTGSMKVSMNTGGDYSCRTNRTCTAGDGWVYLG